MATPRIGAGILPGTPEVKPGDETPTDAAVHETVESFGFDVKELLEPQGVAPDPPKCVLERLRREDKVWRWLSEPMCRRYTMRMYETFSPNARERELINSGKDTKPGVRVDAENRIKWLDDTFLGVIPRRLYLQRQALKRARIDDQTKKSRNQDAITEAARQAGAKITDFSVKSWEADEMEDEEPR
jgi:hypothetical protein